MKTTKPLTILLLFLLLACNLPVSNGTPIPDAQPSDDAVTAETTPDGADRASDATDTPAPVTPTIEQPPADAPVYKDLTARPQIWFGPLDPWSWDRYFPGAGPFQYYDLFTENADWEQAAGAVQIIRLYPVWLESYATPEQLETVLADIQRRGIAISYEAGPLTETARCNAATVEGFWGIPAAQGIVNRIAAAGGTLYSMDLEHPFDAGTYDDPACRRTPAEIAADAARTIAAVREVFPDVRVGSIETADLDVNAVAAWMTAYREATGQELDYFHLDINFTRPDWAERAREIQAYVQSRGVEFGIIYFGDAEDSSDAEWLAHAEARFVEFEVFHGGQPDHVVFQSWHPHPQKLFPETDPDAFTNLILRYLRPRTDLTLALDGQTVSGALHDDAGAPLAGAPLQIGVRPISGDGVLAEYVISGIVPEAATLADTGFRINMECDCRGAAEFVLDQVVYEDGGTGGVPNGSFASGLDYWGIWGSGTASLVDSPSRHGQALAVSVGRNQALGLNSGEIAVTPGTPFSLTITAQIDPGSAGSGYFDIIFLNDAGEVRRLTTPIEAGPAILAETVTASGGAYLVTLDQLPAGAFELFAWYAGDDAYWPARAHLVVQR